MPKRSRMLTTYEKQIHEYKEATLFHLAMEDNEPTAEVNEEDDSSTSSNILLSLMTTQLELEYESHLSERYLQSRNAYRTNANYSVFERDLIDDDDNNGTPPWLTDEEFLQKYRLHRENFDHIVSSINQHLVFKGDVLRRPQSPPSHQLMVLLHYLGTSGSGANNPRMRNVFGIGRGTVELFKRRCVTAIRSIKNKMIKWSDDREKKEIARRILHASNQDWINCIGVADGTLIPLTFAPQSSDAPDYHGRKHPYSLSVMIINDDLKRIRMYHAGNPGCVHDSRVYGQLPLSTHPEQYFSNQRYFLLGDSAFTNSPTMVTSFKAPRGHSLTKDQEAFNKALGKIRVTSEHSIGMLTVRFPIL